ncbi:glucokinase [Marilutibacter aestuarii]|nr:glucokinase [Lysobacter aestuarii]
MSGGDIPMAASTRSKPASLSCPLIAADVGGTHARLALVDASRGAPQVELHGYRRYSCADYPSLAAILSDFIAEQGLETRPEAAIAIAGLLVGDTLVHANLPWSVSVSGTAADAELAGLRLINDFEAMAWAVPSINLRQARRICGPEIAVQPGPAMMIGPGTGFGAALRVPGDPPVVVATEAGHAALSVRDPRELQVLSVLMKRWSHVGNERVLSGPGLVNAYEALCEIEGIEPRLDTPARITHAAQTGDDPLAAEALSMFCSILASVAGDLALTFGAKSVYLAGGIPAQIADFLLAGDFASRFVDKGVMSEVLARVPVYLVEHGQLGLLGAATWYLEQRRADAMA